MGDGGRGRLCPGSALQARMVRIVRMDSVCIRLVRVIRVQGTRLTPDGHSLFSRREIPFPSRGDGREDGWIYEMDVVIYYYKKE